MRLIITKEIYRIKGLKRPGQINLRMENVILSLAYLENEYRNKYSHTEISFEKWLYSGSSDFDYRCKYIKALLLPIDGYKNVHQFNACNDAYYQKKLDKKLIVAFTEQELRRRRYEPEKVYQSKRFKGTFGDWFDLKGRETFPDPLVMVLIQEESKELKRLMYAAGFLIEEVEIIFQFYSTAMKRGSKKEICEQFKITRDKLKWLLKKVDKFNDKNQIEYFKRLSN
jgi:hypothetical protein